MIINVLVMFVKSLFISTPIVLVAVVTNKIVGAYLLLREEWIGGIVFICFCLSILPVRIVRTIATAVLLAALVWLCAPVQEIWPLTHWGQATGLLAVLTCVRSLYLIMLQPVSGPRSHA